MMYKLQKDPKTNEVCAITIVGQNISIPLSPENTDYQAFLKYQAEGGKVYGADEEVPNGQANQ